MGVQRAMQGQCRAEARAPHRRCAEDPVGLLTLAATPIRRWLEVEREEGGGEQCARAV